MMRFFSLLCMLVFGSVSTVGALWLFWLVATSSTMGEFQP